MSVAETPRDSTSPPDARGNLDTRRLKRILGQFVTGVCAASTRFPGPSGARHDAIAVNSFTSVSLDPPLVSMCLRDDSTFLERLRVSGRWAVSFLGRGERSLVRVLTMPSVERPPVEEAARWEVGAHTGCLVLSEGPGALECELHVAQTLGDHVLVVGRVLGAEYRDDEPLVFHRGAFTEVTSSE